MPMSHEIPKLNPAALLFFGALAIGTAEQQKSQDIAIPRTIEPFFGKYCLGCHDADTAKGDLNLEGLTRRIAITTDAENWQDILDKLNAGEMPPKKKRQPSREDLATVVGDLTESLQSAQKMLRDSGGTIVVRRINRREYQATIKELMGVRLNGEKLPDDPSGRFDTIGQNQSLNAMQLERYFSFAQEVARMALHWARQPRSETKVVRKSFANSVKKERRYSTSWKRSDSFTKRTNLSRKSGSPNTNGIATTAERKNTPGMRNTATGERLQVTTRTISITTPGGACFRSGTWLTVSE